jgi:hypothetical protein
MHRPITIASTLVLAVLLGALSLLYLREARAARQERQRALEALGELSGDCVQKLDLRAGELRSALAASERRETEMIGLLGKLARSLEAAPPAPAPSSAEPAPPQPELDSLKPPPPALPEIPAGLDLQTFIAGAGDLKALAASPEVNPTGRTLSRVERLELLAEVQESQAALEALDAEVKVAVARGVETLRERGDFIEYRKGERYETSPGVLTAGEETEGGGVRMFYLHPEELQEVYDKKARRGAVLQHSVRRILGRVQGIDPGEEP